MQNIVKLQDYLRMQPDEYLIEKMQRPTEDVPQFLVAGILNERKKMREESKKAPEGTVADEIVQSAQQPMGIMNLPDETLAGAAMRARISGQQQQAPDGMVAMPPQQQAAPQPQAMPQGMADGGAVQFGNIFGDMGGNAPMQASQTPELMKQSYMPTNGYVAPKTDDYSNFRHQFDGRPTPHAPNPRVHMSDAERYGLPKGMAAPTYGTPGLERTYSGRDGQNVRYSWSDPSYRDAYIRYMTPPTAANTGNTSAAAALNAASTVPARAMSSGGVAHFDGTTGSDVALSPQDKLPSYMYSMFEDPNDPFGIRENFGTPSAPVSGTPPSRDEADPMSGGIGALTGNSFLSGLKDKYAGMTEEPSAKQPIPKVNAYAFEPTPTQETPVEKLRDYAGETKAEINKLLEGLSGDSEALKQRDRDMALAQAGFAIAASKNPNAFGAIGEGAQTGIADYVKSRKEAKALDTERIKAQIAAASSAGEMGQRQGLTEAEMGQRDRISNREVGSRERLAKAQLAQSAEIANIEAMLKGEANNIDANYKNKVLSMDTDEQRLYASLDPLKQGDIGRGFAVSNAFKLISSNNDIINDYTASQKSRDDALEANRGLYKMIGIGGGTDFDASKYTPSELFVIEKYGGGAKGEAAARAAGMLK